MPRSSPVTWRSRAGCRRRSHAGSTRSCGRWTTRRRSPSRGWCSSFWRPPPGRAIPTEARAASPSWILRARDLLHADLARRRTLANLAAEVGVHPVTLARGFRRSFGCSVGEYVRRLRIERAASQLGGSEVPLAEIALAAGFSDQSHFSNLFRRETGMSPSAYRRAMRRWLSPAFQASRIRSRSWANRGSVRSPSSLGSTRR